MIDNLIFMAQKKNASDVHLAVGYSPMIRVNGKLIKLTENILKDSDTLMYMKNMLTDEQLNTFKSQGELDFAYVSEDNIRCRVNAFKQMNKISIAIRIISSKIKSFADLYLPEKLTEFASLQSGLVLVTGATGSGKSTTLASIIDYINENTCQHIITLEDPVEYVYEYKKSLINQREIGRDTSSFACGLRNSLREDPDVILVGEMRDRETIETALTAAETGHLVFATLHTRDAVATVNRIIDIFPDKQQQVRSMLAECLQGIIAQELIYSTKLQQMLPVVEIMLSTPAVQNLIREGKTHQLKSYLQTGQQYGMFTKEYYFQQLKAKNLF